jgi:[ribosomal protein S5]-alanine N-acetyltransferase
VIGPRAFSRTWPATLRHDDVLVRPLRLSDAAAWQQVRERNADWLRPWEATAPPGSAAPLTSYRALARRLRSQGRAQTTLPYVVEVDGAFAGQVTVNNVVRGSALFASVGYWVDSAVAGRGVIPRAVALVIDHCLATGLHRIEVAIRPENSNSLRVVEKLGLRQVGFAPCYLHIDGEWRDHRLYAITREEWPPGGLLSRVLGDQG